MEIYDRGVYIKPGIYAFDKEKVANDEASPDDWIVFHSYKGKSRGVSLVRFWEKTARTTKTATFNKNGSIISTSWL